MNRKPAPDARAPPRSPAASASSTRSRPRPARRPRAGPPRRRRGRCRRRAARPAPRPGPGRRRRGSASGTGTDAGSRGCGPASDLQAQPHVGRRVRAIGPSTAISWNASGPSSGGITVACGTRPVRRLDRGDAAAVRRVAQRAADVVAEAERAHARRRAPRPRRRSSRPRCTSGCHGLRVRPRSAGVGVDAQAHVGQVGAAERDRPGRAQPLDQRRVDRRRSPRPSAATPWVVGGAGDVDVLLHRERHAVQRAERLAVAVRRRPRRPRPAPRRRARRRRR